MERERERERERVEGEVKSTRYIRVFPIKPDEENNFEIDDKSIWLFSFSLLIS